MYSQLWHFLHFFLPFFIIVVNPLENPGSFFPLKIASLLLHSRLYRGQLLVTALALYRELFLLLTGSQFGSSSAQWTSRWKRTVQHYRWPRPAKKKLTLDVNELMTSKRFSYSFIYPSFNKCWLSMHLCNKPWWIEISPRFQGPYNYKGNKAFC